MKAFKIAERTVGGEAPCYIIAEISCNHEGDINEAKRIIYAASEAGADAVKLQTYRADTMTQNFNIKPSGTMWEHVDLFKLYQKAYTPWDWHSELAKTANELGLDMFSTPFDETAVDHLMSMNVPVMKIASFEAIDIKLIEKVAKTELPVIISNGMTDFLEMKEAIDTLRKYGCNNICVTHCNSGYPASFDEVNLVTMKAIKELFDVTVGLSDHTIYADDISKKRAMAHITPIEAVKFGAKLIEVHLTMDREQARKLNENNEGGFDWPFSREPAELKKIVDMIRQYEASGHIEYDSKEEAKEALRTHGKISFDPTSKEINSRKLRPSLWITRDVEAGKPLKFAAENTDSGNFNSLRPSGGIHIRYADYLENKLVSRDLKAGEKLTWEMIKI